MKAIHSKYATVDQLIFPDAITLKFLISGQDTNGKFAILEDIVQPGVGPGRHIHHHQDETFFFLEGDFIAEVGGNMMECRPGDIAFIPKGTTHAFKNVGNSPGRLRYIFTPALTIEDMFREFYDALDNGNFEMDIMSDIALKHGQEFVGPPL